MKTPLTVLGRGSSKDLVQSQEHPSYIGFDFSDRISVFDYGALPDPIPNKGKNLERTAWVFFRELQASHIPTAFDAAISKEHSKIFLRAAQHPRFPVPHL